MLKEITFTSRGVRCAAWHLPALIDALAGPRGNPAIVMANGFGGTRDTGLLTFAGPFAAAGFDVLVFDYRGFGASDGAPRQDVSFRRQREDYHAAIAVARQLPGVDLERIALWGTSYSGGHALAVAAQDRRIAAIVSMNPATDGVATLWSMVRHAGLGKLLRAAGNGLRDVARAIAKRSPYHVPIVGALESAALMTTSGAEAAYTSIAGPTWRNEVCARTALEVGFNRPTIYARRLACPMLMQVGANDRVAPPGAARRAAMRAGHLAELREYPLDHFDFYAEPWQKQVVAEQIEFLSRICAADRTRMHG